MKRAAAAAVLALILSGCGTSIDVQNRGDGTCIQERHQRALGITYSSTQNLINCEAP